MIKYSIFLKKKTSLPSIKSYRGKEGAGGVWKPTQGLSLFLSKNGLSKFKSQSKM